MKVFGRILIIASKYSQHFSNSHFFLKTIVFLQIFILWRTKRGKENTQSFEGRAATKREEKFFPASDSGFR